MMTLPELVKRKKLVRGREAKEGGGGLEGRASLETSR